MRKETLDRRSLCKGAALCLTAMAAGSLAFAESALAEEGGFNPDIREASAESQKETSRRQDVDPSAQYGFLVNVNRCIACGECEEACRLWNRIPESLPSRRRIADYVTKSGKTVHLSYACMHCEHPSCAEVCPAQAITKEDGGIVKVNKDRCIGCKYCYQACPFGIPQYDSVSMYKCDYCTEAGVELGEPPHCVQACKVHALRYGKMSDLMALSSKCHQVEGPTGASCVLV